MTDEEIFNAGKKIAGSLEGEIASGLKGLKDCTPADVTRIIKRVCGELTAFGAEWRDELSHFARVASDRVSWVRESNE